MTLSRLLEPRIHPLVKVGPVYFGMTREMVRKLLGDPDEKRVHDWGEGDCTEYWEYPKLGLQVDFDSDEDWRASAFSLSQGSIDGIEPIGRKVEDGLAALAEQAGHSFVLTDDFLDLCLSMYCCYPIGLTLWVSEGLISGMDVFPEYDENGDNILWPDSDAG